MVVQPEDADDMADDDFDEESMSQTVIIEAQDRPTRDDKSERESAVDETEATLDDELADQNTADQSAGYDRQEMVKTIQMTAIDRKAFERQVQAEQIGDSALLLDHSHAPDVIVFPPRVLTTRWKEGGPLLRAGEVDPPTGEIPLEVEAETVEPDSDAASSEEPATASADAESKEEQIREYRDDEQSETDEGIAENSDPGATLEEEDFPEIEPEAVEIELDSEAIEDAGEIKPPPKPAPQTPKKPDQSSLSDQKKKDSAKPAKPADGKDPELSGLVQELLDEKKVARKKKTQKPRSPRDTWFQKVFTEEYLRTLPKDIHRQTKREVDFIEESLELDDSDRVLDLACGFGRHSIEMTKRGHEVAGFDLSMPLLQKALNEAQKQSLSIKFIHGDMRELTFEGIFSACFLWQTSFGYFDDQTNFRVLRGIHRALKPGGRVLIDVLNRDHIVTEMPHRLWWEGVECVFLEEVELDHRSSVLHTKRSFIYEDGSPPLEHNTFIRIYSLHELCQLLRAAGFAVREVSGELHHRGRFLGSASSRIIVHAQKRPPRGGRK
jgi:SAM-dependent methyltransferase